MLGWAWRLFRREWRRRALVLALLGVAVAVTFFGLGTPGTASAPGSAQFGKSDYLMNLPRCDPALADEVAAARHASKPGTGPRDRRAPAQAR
jgi:hypothetical protein